MDNVKIIVATHKAYRMPKDPMYLPLHVGAHGKSLDLEYVKDDIGDNISEKNPYYCELTGLYWAWKHVHASYIGLVHYRRYFKGTTPSKDKFEQVLKEAEIRQYIPKIKVFVPKKRKYYIETLYTHYAHTHYAEHLDKTRQILENKYPEYVPYYDKVVQQTHGYMFNMMIMEHDLLDMYCTWLFDILGQLETKVDTAKLSAFQSRFYGRVSEIIFNAWLAYQIDQGTIRNDEIKELPLLQMESTNWIKKGGSFIKAKFFHKKYEGSF